ncbi:MAG: DedA family protein [Patescibacteria group bacterium]|nr:MAG: DedA family protein [Patescibacteria group bacterium]
MTDLLNLFLHLDETLGTAIASYGNWIYGVLFLIVFCETGLIVTPFLPGDSLLFAAGAFSATGVLNVWVIWVLLFVAAVIGDGVNYRIGRKVGARILEKGSLGGLPIKKEHIERTQQYYDKYGAKTIVIARFLPIIRTFAPFVAGVGHMKPAVFSFYNVFGAALWVTIFVFGGYFFGNVPVIKKNFEFVIIAMIIIPGLPALIQIIREWQRSRSAK